MFAKKKLIFCGLCLIFLFSASQKSNAADPCLEPNPPAFLNCGPKPQPPQNSTPNYCLNPQTVEERLNCAKASSGSPGTVQVNDDIKFTYPGLGQEVYLNKGDFNIQRSNINSLEEFSAKYIRFLTGIVVLITIVVFMIGAGFWIFSSGDEALVGRGKDMMIYSTIGICCVLGAYVIVKVVQVALYVFGT